MIRALLVIALVACKRDDVPFKPPPKLDAAAAAVDGAATQIHAAAKERPTATKLAVSDRWSCAVMSDATLRCWGKNSDGQLGDGTTTDAAKPVAPKLRGVKDVVLGAAHACALLDDSSVTCWGRINYGKRDNLAMPTGVPGLAEVKRIFALGSASCATMATSSLVCWGDVDIKGHLRLTGGPIERRIPTPSSGLARVTALTPNGALHEDGSVSFWAADGVPVRSGLTGVTEIASIGDEVCGLRGDGSVACVGPSTRCAAALPKPAPKAKPKAPAKQGRAKAAAKPKAPKVPPKAAEAKLPIEVLAGLPKAKHLAFDVGLCVVTATGKLQCLNATDGCQVDAPWPGLANIETATGSCARTTDGGARCWAVDTRSRTVTAITGVAGASAIATSSSHACALLGDRSIVCWGSNKHGALGRGEADDINHPEALAVAF